jgi:hypothetical protein
MTARVLTKAMRGQWHGSYGTARCPAHDDRNPSLSVSDGPDGKLLVHCHAGCSQAEVWAALKDRGLVGERRNGPVMMSRRREISNAVTGLRPRSDRGAEAKTDFARRIWAESRPASGTPVERYLKSRGLAIETPPTLRYHPGLKHSPTGLFLPAMVAAVTVWPGREVVAIHRTFLVADGRKKAPVSQNKMALGRCTGGAVRLVDHVDEMVLAEGIETALSVLQATTKPTWACLSTSFLKTVILPPEVTTVIIAADGDEPGEKAAKEAARRFYTEGREVKIARPPAGMDFNDLLMKPENVIPFPQEAAHG